MTYKVVIIEDKKRIYNLIKDHVKRLSDDLDIELESGVREANQCLNFELYIQMLEHFKADIYFVDWELFFQDGSKANADQVLRRLEKNERFNKKNQFWIFYSGEDVRIYSFSKQFFENKAGCYHDEGIANLIPMEDSPEYDRDFVKETLEKAIFYLDSTRTPEWSSESLRINPNIPKAEIDMYEEGSIWKVVRDGKLERIRINQIRFNIERFFYFIWSNSVKRGILCIIDEKTNNYLFYLIKFRNSSYSVTDSFARYPDNLYVQKPGFLANAKFFTPDAIISAKYKEHLQLRSTILGNIESRLRFNKRSEKDRIKELLVYLRQHGVYD